MKKFAIGCGLLLVVVAGGLATILYTGKKKFEPKVTRILEQVSGDQVQAIYDEAAPAGIATFMYHWRSHRFELFGFYVGPPR